MLFRGTTQKVNEKRPFADMHCHILPGVDDGSRDEKMSLEMLEIAAREGITDMILTPHYIPGRSELPKEKIERGVERMQELAAEHGIEIRLYPGAEFYFAEQGGHYLEHHLVETLNGTNRLLMEFPIDADGSYIFNAVNTAVGFDYVPVIAHVERYAALFRNKADIYRLKEIGAELQVNALTLEGDLGGPVRRFVETLLREHLIDYIGTDAHSTGRRSPAVKNCLDRLYQKFGRTDAAYIEEITFQNAKLLMDI